MDDKLGVLIAVCLGVAMLIGVVLLAIPEPAERAVVSTERLDIAVLSFENTSPKRGIEETLRARIEARLVNEPAIEVYNRTQLDALLLEHALATSGFLDTSAATTIGSLTGVGKLVTGSVLGASARAEETTVCERWEDGACADEVPGVRYTVTLHGQVQIINAETGRIEHALDLAKTASTTLKASDLFLGYSGLFAEAAGRMADETAERIASTYTREVRYDLYRDVETKRSGYVGQDPANRFDAKDEAAILVVHFVRARDADTFDVLWKAPDGTEVDRIQDVVDQGAWGVYRLDLDGLENGRYHVEGWLAGVRAFNVPFAINR